jgi:hypothetical protein
MEMPEATITGSSWKQKENKPAETKKAGRSQLWMDQPI